MDSILTCFLLVLSCTSTTNLVQAADRNVEVSLGKSQILRGLNTTNGSGRTVYKFLGIPYAIPPLGGRRFKPPEPAADWTGVKNATTRGAICHQGAGENVKSMISEDCLIMNVFTPDVNASLPVFVWIHGGAYRTGSGGDGGNFVSEGVVAVTINYRLGAFGYFSTGDSVMPGNYGMLDQVLAIKWVQKHISSFGGDPSQVTIGGESAGAHSVSLLNLSPLTKGLFKRIIMDSGSALSLTAFERPGNRLKVKDTTLRSAARVGCNQATSSEIMLCLQKVDAYHLMNATQDATPEPRVETTFGFMPEDPFEILKKGNYNKVDTLHGTNTGEASGSVVDTKNDGLTRDEAIKDIGNMLGSYINGHEIAKLIEDAYIGNETDPMALRKNTFQATTDLRFGLATMVEDHYYVSDTSNTKNYLYEFAYRVSGTSTPVWEGVAHAAELHSVFYGGGGTADDRAVGLATRGMWMNFVKHGDPTPSTGSGVVKWNAYTKSSPKMLKIDVHSTLVDFPRPFMAPLYEKVLGIMKLSTPIPVVG